MATRIALAALAVPLVLFAALLYIPGLDESWGTPAFHFYAVSAASLLAAGICAVLVLSARSIRQTRILFLALCFFSLGMIFAVHGLTTPGFMFDEAHAAVQRSPWVATLAAGFFAALSVISVPKIMERSRLHVAEAIFGVFAVLICAYFIVSLAEPDFAAGFPTTEAWFRHVLTGVTVTLLCYAGLRYFQSYQFARLPGQLAVSVGLLFLAEAQLSLNFGQFWYYSWWMYHFLFLASFATVLLGWTWELVRARDAGAIAEGIAMRDALSQLNRGRPTSVVSLANQIENHDLETFRHVDRVAAFAFAIGKDMGLGPARLRGLVLAAQMHDIGKIGLPPYILQKTGKLTDDEFGQIKLHPGKGFEIVGRVHGLADIAGIIRHHHEHFDGSGYPDALGGDDIPLDARIISAADTFDALTSERPYRAAMSVTDAKVELLRVAGTQLDPNCVQSLIRLIERGTVSPNKAPDEVPAAV